MRYLLIILLNFFYILNLHSAAPRIIIATSNFDPPFEMASDEKGHFFGFEIDLMNAICTRLKMECIYKAFTFNQILDSILKGTVDLGLDGISITPERQKIYAFSLPYLVSKARILTKSDSPIRNINHIRENVTIGVEKGTLFPGLAKKMFPGVKISELDANGVISAIAAGNVDVVILDDPSAQYWVTNNSGMFKYVGQSIPLGLGYGIMANLANKSLIDKINQILIQMENDGTYIEIYSRYF